MKRIIRLKEAAVNRNAVLTFLLTVIGLAIACFVFKYSGITMKSLRNSFLTFDLRYLAAVIGASSGIIYFLSKKWSTIVTVLVKIERKAKGYFYCYSAMGLLSNTFVPHVGNYGLKAFSLNGLYSVPLSVGALSVLMEQLFDLTVIIVFAVPSLLYVLGIVPAGSAMLIIFLSASAVVFLSVYRPRLLFTAILSGYKFIYRFVKRLTRNRNFNPSIEGIDSIILDRHIDAKLLFYSYMKYGFTALKLFLVMAALKMRVTYIDILLVTTLVQIVVLVGSTPCAIGSSEAGWLIVLTLLGIDKLEIGNFLIVERVIGSAALILVTFLSYLYYTVNKSITRPSLASAKEAMNG